HQHQRVVVDVDDPGLGRDGLGDLVGVVGGGQPGADVQELPGPRLAGQVGDGADQERPGGAGQIGDLGQDPQDLVADLPVDRVVVLAAEPVVPDPGDVGDGGVDPGG